MRVYFRVQHLSEFVDPSILFRQNNIPWFGSAHFKRSFLGALSPVFSLPSLL